MIFTASRRPSECVASDRKRQQRMVCLVSCEKGLFNLFFAFGFQNHEVTVRGILQHSHFKLKCVFFCLYQSTRAVSTQSLVTVQMFPEKSLKFLKTTK